MRKVTVSRIRERYAQTVLTYRITYVYVCMFCMLLFSFVNYVLLQLIGTIKRTIFRKVRTETILKLYNPLVLPAFLYGSENWTLTTSQRRRIEAAEMKLF